MKFSQPWYRKSRKAWFVTLDGKQIKLGKTKAEALSRFHDLMAKPRTRTVRSDSLVGIMDAFLEWVQNNRSAATYEWYRYRLERFAQQYPDMAANELRPFHVETWADRYPISRTSRRNYLRSVKRCMKWATKQGYIDKNPVENLEVPSGDHKEVFIPEADYEELLTFVRSDYLRDLFVVTWETGSRRPHRQSRGSQQSHWLQFCPDAQCRHARLMQLAGINPHARKTLARNSGPCDLMGMRYLFVNKKGGVGKSTLATAFAVYLHDAGRRVAVLDADEQLHSARAIAEAEPAITVVAEFEPNKIPNTITQLAAQHDDVVCDAPARLSDETRAMMVMADVAIFPMEPTIKCLRSTKESIEVLNYARTVTGGKPEHAWLVLNKAKKRTRIFREVEKLAPSLGLRVAETPIRDLQAFPEADQQGTVVLRVKSDSPSFQKAKADLDALFGQITELWKSGVANG